MVKNSISVSPLLFILLDCKSNDPLQLQIYYQIKNAVLAGRLKPGTRLPATRALAKQLGVSRNTVLAAFELLRSEDYIESSPGSVTQITNRLSEDLLLTQASFPYPPNQQDAAGKVSKLAQLFGANHHRNRHHTPGMRAFRPGLPELDEFPFKAWSRMVGRFWRQPPIELLSSGDAGGYLPLRQAIATYLGAVRDVRCQAEQVFITSGAQQAIDLVARATIDPGDHVWVENPGYAGLNSAFIAAGALVNHIGVDGEGISVREGVQKAAGAVLAAVTPSHQYPLGITMSLKRRLELLEWANAAGAWILEDDFDSEYRYRGKPLSALQGLDQSSRVIYVGTFSKVLFASLRLGYVVVPESLVDAIRKIRLAVDDYPSLALQPALSGFIAEGHFSSHIRKMRKLYAERQEMLIDALRREADGLLSVAASDAGMHLVSQIPSSAGLSDQAASQLARQAGLNAPAVSDYCTRITRPDGLLLGYAGLSEFEINRDVKKLAQALQHAQ